MVCLFVLNALLDKELVMQDAIIIVNNQQNLQQNNVSCTEPEKNI
jgi:hypothetical protein